MNTLVKKVTLIFTVGMLAAGTGATITSENVNAASRISVTYTLKNFKKKVSSKKLRVKKGTTVLAGLKKAWKVRSNNGFVTSIHGYNQNKGKKIFWTYTINGKWAQAANKVKLHNHDHVVWTRSKY